MSYSLDAFCDDCRTALKADEGEMDAEDLIAQEDVVITVSRAGYVKRQPIEAFRRQGRGGKGVRGQNLKEEDVVSEVFTTTTHHWLLFFTNRGKVYRVKVHQIPEASRTARGLYAANLPGVAISSEERISAVMDLKEYAEGTKPIPTKEELQEEGREKAKAAQDGNGQRKVGPEIIASAPPGLIPESQPIPARPD